MTDNTSGLVSDIEALRAVLERLIREERDLNRLVTGAARLATAIVQAERLRHQVAGGESEDDYP
ncbi:MAG: hypothetical protein R2839_09195 [Thermomicrobiales bacterium]